jgi:ABC-type polar amino acid transport system ATPase subunit
VFEIMEMRPDIADPAVPAALPKPVRGRVAFEEVSFRYHKDPSHPWTVDGVSLTVAPGEIVALVGPSGGGKTTLVSLLPRFWDVDQGRITLDGLDALAPPGHLRESIGVVPQEPALFSGSVRENIAYARPGASAADVESAARAAHAAEFIERLPQRYETLVGERGVKLSGGQRQRIAIARAILKDPAVLILDEAMSNLTPRERLIETRWRSCWWGGRLLSSPPAQHRAAGGPVGGGGPGADRGGGTMPRCWPGAGSTRGCTGSLETCGDGVLVERGLGGKTRQPRDIAGCLVPAIRAIATPRAELLDLEPLGLARHGVEWAKGIGHSSTGHELWCTPAGPWHRWRPSQSSCRSTWPRRSRGNRCRRPGALPGRLKSRDPSAGTTN